MYFVLQLSLLLSVYSCVCVFSRFCSCCKRNFTLFC